MSVEILRYAAFTDGGRGGNPAGVVLDAGRLSDDQMLAIARTVGYSETAFLTASGGPVRTLRFFSPLAEVDFCGHATLATAVALAEREGPGELAFETPAGRVDVTTSRVGADLTATLTSPPASSRPAAREEIDQILAAFGWSSDVLDPAFPVHVASAGNQHPVIGVRDRQTLMDFDYDFDELAAVMRARRWTTVHVFSRRSDDEYDVRNAFPPGGVREDPATGAAAAAFGGYLRDLGRLDEGTEILLHQGEDLGRPSRLTIRRVPGSPSIAVRGTAGPMPSADDPAGAPS